MGGIPERTRRIHSLRRQMDRIKAEINALLEQEGTSVPEEAPGGALQAITCVGCRHDEITGFMEEDLRLNPFLRGISVRGGLILDHERRPRAWWATTLRLGTEKDLARFIRTVENLCNYLQQVSDPQLMAKLHQLAAGEEGSGVTAGEEGPRVVEKGVGMGLMKRKGSGCSLTPKGWELYVTLAHLVHNHVVKLDPEKAQLISLALADRLGWIHGTLDDMTPYHMAMAQKMELVRRSGTLSYLLRHGLTEDEIREFLYDNWEIQEDTQTNRK